jgi:hypothetical protein
MALSTLKVEFWPIERLIPYARNARTHSDQQVAQIAASIAEFGFINPVLADSDGGIIAGHYRRFWIRRSSSERRRDLNPPDQCAAHRKIHAGGLHRDGLDSTRC